MISRFSASIRLDAGPSARALHDSLSVDNAYYDGPDTVDIRRTDDGIIIIEVSASRLAHLRAGINSVLRLAKAAHGTIESADFRQNAA